MNGKPLSAFVGAMKIARNLPVSQVPGWMVKWKTL